MPRSLSLTLWDTRAEKLFAPKHTTARGGQAASSYDFLKTRLKLLESGCATGRLFNVCPAFALSGVPVQRDLFDFNQVQVVPLERVSVLIRHFQVPVDMFVLIVESDLDAVATGQSVLAQNIFFPIVGAVRGNVQRMDLYARLVMQHEILLAAAGQR